MVYLITACDISRCKRPPFGFQYATFQPLKGHLSECERYYLDNQVVMGEDFRCEKSWFRTSKKACPESMPFYVLQDISCLELVVYTKQDICSVEVKTERINLCIMYLVVLVTDETYMGNKAQIVGKLDSKARLETYCEYIRVNIIATIQMLVSQCAVYKDIDNL